jgi:hypothetical protein
MRRLIKRAAAALSLHSLSTLTLHAYQGCLEFPEAYARFPKNCPPKLIFATMLQSLGLRGQILRNGSAEEACPGNADRALWYPALSFFQHNDLGNDDSLSVSLFLSAQSG